MQLQISIEARPSRDSFPRVVVNLPKNSRLGWNANGTPFFSPMPVTADTMGKSIATRLAESLIALYTYFYRILAVWVFVWPGRVWFHRSDRAKVEERNAARNAAAPGDFDPAAHYHRVHVRYCHRRE